MSAADTLRTVGSNVSVNSASTRPVLPAGCGWSKSTGTLTTPLLFAVAVAGRLRAGSKPNGDVNRLSAIGGLGSAGILVDGKCQ